MSMRKIETVFEAIEVLGHDPDFEPAAKVLERPGERDRPSPLEAIRHLRRALRGVVTTRRLAGWLGVSPTVLCQWAPTAHGAPDIVCRRTQLESDGARNSQARAGQGRGPGANRSYGRLLGET